MTNIDISDNGSISRDVNISDEGKINDQGSQDDSKIYEIGEDDGIFDSIIIILLHDIVLLLAWLPFLILLYQSQWLLY